MVFLIHACGHGLKREGGRLGLRQRAPQRGIAKQCGRRGDAERSLEKVPPAEAARDDRADGVGMCGRQGRIVKSLERFGFVRKAVFGHQRCLQGSTAPVSYAANAMVP
jgi:hypothetical protein